MIASQSWTNIRLLKGLYLVHLGKAGLAKVKNLLNWAVFTKVQKRKTKWALKVKIAFSDIVLMEQKNSLTLATPITNELTRRYGLYISSNNFLTKVVLSIQGKILERNTSVAFSGLPLAVLGAGLR